MLHPPSSIRPALASACLALLAGLACTEQGGAPDPDPPPRMDCAPLEAIDGVALCAAGPNTCEAVYEDGRGCAAVCAAAGLTCLRAHENLDAVCAADHDRAAVPCDSGHESDYCVCGAADHCEPLTCATAPQACGAGFDDGCGGTFDCPAACPGGADCVDGRCRPLAARCAEDDCPAFPGAEGEGMYARGGRGGDVYHVTTAADSGPGSLRAGLAGDGGPRTIVFDVGGLIDLRSPLRSDRSRLTIAGETAPGDGITLRGYQTDLRGDHLIIRHLRFRAGDIRKATRDRDGFTEDSLTVSGSAIIIDHVSASWGIDESLSAGSRVDNLTVQYAIVAEGLHHTELFHGEYDPDRDGHSMGSLIKPSEGDADVTVHHTLFAHNNNRNPAVGTYERDQRMMADIRNNVIYNCNNSGYTSGESDWIRMNYVGNAMVFGADSGDLHLFEPTANNNVTLYAIDNRRDVWRDGRLVWEVDPWGAIAGEYDAAGSPFAMRPVTTQPADEAFETVLAEAGARPWNRDPVDARIVADVRNGTGRRIDSQDEVGGWPAVRAGQRVVDTDRDGMPDDYERAAGTDPDRADNNGDADGDGYTNLENYLHHAAAGR